MTTYRFDEIKESRTVKLKCQCGKRFQRVLSASMTVNPFNRNPDGTVRTYQEVVEAVREKLAAATLPERRKECPGCGGRADIVEPRAVAS